MKNLSLSTVLLLLSLFVLIPFADLLASGQAPKMVEHTLGHGITIHLPSSMQVSENLLENQSQVSYSVHLSDNEKSLRGYIQVWQLDHVERFLAESKEKSSFDFYSYSLNPIRIGTFGGWVNTWGASFGELHKISGKEYWLKQDTSKVLRISFITSNPSFSDEQEEIIHEILKTLVWE